jgi:crotonobetainyl-CoA:carnitine CoA-transferase CaiB-like acyl-CoA transferase
MSGLYHAIGEADGPPLICGTGIADPNAASHACMAVLAALFYRERTGIGQYVDTAMLDSMIFMDAVTVPRAAITEGEDDPKRSGQHHNMVVPWGNYYCKGEYVLLEIVGSGEDSMWGRFCKVIGHPDMITDPRFDTPEHRVENKDETIRIIQEWFGKQPSAYEAAEYLQKHRVCSAPVLTARQVALGHQVRDRELMRKVYHPVIDREAFIPVTPYKYSKTPITVESGAPLLGQHNEHIMKKYLGYSDKKIKELHDTIAVYQEPRVAKLRAAGKI